MTGRASSKAIVVVGIDEVKGMANENEWRCWSFILYSLSAPKNIRPN